MGAVVRDYVANMPAIEDVDLDCDCKHTNAEQESSEAYKAGEKAGFRWAMTLVSIVLTLLAVFSTVALLIWVKV